MDAGPVAIAADTQRGAQAGKLLAEQVQVAVGQQPKVDEPARQPQRLGRFEGVLERCGREEHENQCDDRRRLGDQRHGAFHSGLGDRDAGQVMPDVAGAHHERKP